MSNAELTPLGRLSLPDGEGDPSTKPGVVFIHDVWGPSPHAEQFCDRLADAGFVVLAVDFYRNLETGPANDPGAFIRGLSDPDVLADVERGLALLATRPECVGEKLGVTGVCMGGMYTLLAACTVPGLEAAAPFYGMLSYDHGLVAGEGRRDMKLKPTSPLEAAGRLSCPLLAFFGEQDDFVPMSDVAALKAQFAGVAHDNEIVTYADAGHAFMNQTRPEAHRPQAAEDAWVRLVAFFGTHLAAR